MKLLGLISTLLIVSFISAGSATAQIGLYAEYNATHIPSTSFTGTTTAWYSGFAGGAYFNVLHPPLIALGLDLRGGYASGQGHDYRAFLSGRVSKSGLRCSRSAHTFRQRQALAEFNSMESQPPT
jgi:hypothetical protein